MSIHFSYGQASQDGSKSTFSDAVKSPNAASFEQFGQIPVSLFNGLPKIDVPIGKLNCGQIDIPLNISYHAGGNRADLHPGWVGLGWSLPVGGIITRKKNGVIDELAANSYWTNKHELGASNWNTLSFVQGLNGKDLSPDEFSFSVAGLNASFYLNHLGEWKVKSKDNLNLRIECELDNGLKRSINKFVVTSDDGIKYLFGGPGAIEISYPALQFVPPILDPSFYDINPPYLNINSTGWYLTDIISPLGDTVKFMYSTAYASFNQTSYTNIYYEKSTNQTLSGTNINKKSIYLVETRYLDRIEANNGMVVV